MTRPKQIALGVGVGTVAAILLGTWGSAGGVRGLIANASSLSLPLAAFLIVKARKPGQQDDPHQSSDFQPARSLVSIHREGREDP